MILSALLIVSVAVFTEATICTSSTDCGTDECCYIKPEFQIVSKRQLVLPHPVSHKSKTGVCESYRSFGDQCGPFEKANGHCGCPGGMACQWVPDKTTVAPIVRRKLVAHNEPGAYRCANV